MNATNLIWIVSFLIVGEICSGCAVVSSSDVNPSTIYTQYSGAYDQASNQISFTAEFFVGGDTGTYVQLDDHSSVTLDSSPMAMDRTIFNQIIYEADQAGALNNPHTFVYTDDSGAVYRNTITIPGSVSFVSPQGSASISSGFTVSWQSSSPVSGDETVVASLTNSSAVATESQMGGGVGGQLYFSANDLKQFTPGVATLTLCRERSTSAVNAPASGGLISLRYCATSQSVTVTN